MPLGKCLTLWAKLRKCLWRERGRGVRTVEIFEVEQLELLLGRRERERSF